MSFLSTLQNIMEIAKDLHKDQQYGSYLPYHYHLNQVLFTAIEFGVRDEDIIIATQLHDSMEDCENVTKEMIEQFTNVRVSELVYSELVYAVTNAPGKNRRAKAKNTYPKIASTPGAVTLKLCDRVANVRQCWKESQRKDGKQDSRLGMYKKEYPGFRKALYREDADEVTKKLWAELDRLLPDT